MSGADRWSDGGIDAPVRPPARGMDPRCRQAVPRRAGSTASR